MPSSSSTTKQELIECIKHQDLNVFIQATSAELIEYYAILETHNHQRLLFRYSLIITGLTLFINRNIFLSLIIPTLIFKFFQSKFDVEFFINLDDLTHNLYKYAFDHEKHDLLVNLTNNRPANETNCINEYYHRAALTNNIDRMRLIQSLKRGEELIRLERLLIEPSLANVVIDELKIIAKQAYSAQARQMNAMLNKLAFTHNNFGKMFDLIFDLEDPITYEKITSNDYFFASTGKVYSIKVLTTYWSKNPHKNFYDPLINLPFSSYDLELLQKFRQHHQDLNDLNFNNPNAAEETTEAPTLSPSPMSFFDNEETISRNNLPFSGNSYNPFARLFENESTLHPAAKIIRSSFNEKFWDAFYIICGDIRIKNYVSRTNYYLDKNYPLNNDIQFGLLDYIGFGMFQTIFDILAFIAHLSLCGMMYCICVPQFSLACLCLTATIYALMAAVVICDTLIRGLISCVITIAILPLIAITHLITETIRLFINQKIDKAVIQELTQLGLPENTSPSIKHYINKNNYKLCFYTQTVNHQEQLVIEKTTSRNDCAYKIFSNSERQASSLVNALCELNESEFYSVQRQCS